MAIRVIGVGDNVVDKYMHTKTMYPGGNAFNFSAYASMLGASSSYMGVFGSDEAAQLVQATARELGIDTSHCRVEEGENGYAMITLVDGDRKFLGSNKGGVAKEKPIHFEEADLEYLNGFSLICTSINSHINPELPKLRPLKPYVAYDFSILERMKYLTRSALTSISPSPPAATPAWRRFSVGASGFTSAAAGMSSPAAAKTGRSSRMATICSPTRLTWSRRWTPWAQATPS